MTLSMPKYVADARIQDAIIQYPWDDWNEDKAEEPIDAILLARLKGLSQRAIIAYTIGTAEWIVFRFGSISDDPLPLQYLEAAWAMIVDLYYCRTTWDDHTEESKGWDGPVRRPLAMSIVKVEY